ncbi:Rha family transcriptional regulator [Clostridium butyricum]|uniref:Phage regulatory protein, Rha family n=1 Tax=Clostridium butyricum E4 str. BoNT E BL5262 TaxID=632245 RepID=C4IHI8_CLOBU|nr:phage regulatory protein [Clostridium butyricum]EEP53667.1 phage regulatory protein, Rha family [Clostridium butyricum E4 str. BoNT E BL5262]NFL30583.1 phage regulatory protein [Clostridium butyricum]NFS19537.1 phage regulatory protein [Clostridium butyricum]
MNKLRIFNYIGRNVTDSREVADGTGKNHAHLMRDIKVYISAISTNPKLDSLDFFIESTYKDGKGEIRPCYLLTKQGCEMVANKMTGEKGISFTAEYVQAFNKMEQYIPQVNMSKELQAILMVDNKAEELKNNIAEVKTDLEDFKDNAPLFNAECKELQALVKKMGVKSLGGKGSAAYKNNSIRCKVYQDIQGQLRREFGVNRYEYIKRCQLSQAINIIQEYTVPIILQDQITTLNNQISF